MIRVSIDNMHNQTETSQPKTILYTHYGDDWIRGSERCLLDLIKHLDKDKFKAILWCNQPIMVEEAKKLNIEVYRSDFPLLLGWQAPRFDVLSFCDLIKEALKLIKTHDVKLIHANSAAPCQWLTFASQQSHVPLICHMHSTYQLRDRLSLGLYQTPMLVGVSQYVVDPLIKDNKPKDEISVIANGIDTERLLSQTPENLRDQLNIAADTFVLACLGSLIHRKGVDLLIEATAKLQKMNVPIHLLVIGEGQEKNNLKQQIENLTLQHNVSLLGECNNAMGVLRGSADLFVSAAREEAFGLVFAEASLAGLAIVAPNTGGIPEVVIDQESGLLTPTEDIDSLVNAIHQLYLDPQQRQQMAEAGKAHVFEHFTIEKNGQKFESLYEQQINNRSKQKPWYQVAFSVMKSTSIALINSYQRKRSAQTKRHLIVVDPTAFSGGSKVATESILHLLDPKKSKVTVLTADKDSWHSENINRVRLFEPQWLAQKEQGLSYFARHAFIALNLFIVRLRFGSFDAALGASGPGVDLSLYLLSKLNKMEVIQLIHGPIAKSRTIARCLNAAYEVHYLQSTYPSLQTSLSTLGIDNTDLPAQFHLLLNGLSEAVWPTPCQTKHPGIFWAASLLKWKGLDTLLSAIQMIPTEKRPPIDICYIKPQGVQLPITKAPISINKVEWHENPNNIDQIRANANIFVSTSKNEPFGLSILEAMAAGQCVVIPADGAYWDEVLQHDIDCIKYEPDNADDLKNKLLMLSEHMNQVDQLGKKAAKVAQGYRAKTQYAHIVSSIEAILENAENKKTNSATGS